MHYFNGEFPKDVEAMVSMQQHSVAPRAVERVVLQNWLFASNEVPQRVTGYIEWLVAALKTLSPAH